MTNLEQLSHAWSQVEALAPELLRPIETQEQYQNALEVIEKLMFHVQDTNALESLLGILLDRVATYEDRILPRRAGRPAGVLAYLMEDRQLTQSALAAATGIDQSTISKLLHEERPFSAAHVRALAAYFGVDAGAFL